MVMDTSAHFRTDLTARQRRLAEALLISPNVSAAAHAAGVARSTAYAWMRLPAFRDELTRAQRAAFDGSLARIASLSAEAVSKLQALLSSPNESIALGAVRLTLEVASTHLESQALAARLEEIEASLMGARR